MPRQDIEEELKQARIDFQARRLENAYTRYSVAEALAKDVIENDGEDADDFALNAYYIEIAISIGDTLVLLERDFETALDRYLRVKTYPLAGNPVRSEELWSRLVRCSLAEGDAAFRRDDKDAAERAYARVLTISDDAAAPAATPLYDGMLRIMGAKVSKWISDPPVVIGEADPRDYPPDMLVLITTVRQRFEHLRNGLNYLGYPKDYTPIFSFSWLQDIAKSFAKFAAQANREYISYTNMAEAETQTIRQFEHSVNLSRAAVSIERSHADVVEAEIDVAERSLSVAQDRADRARRAADRFASTGWQLARLQQAQAWAGAAVVPNSDEIELSFSGLEDLGISSQYERRSKLMQTLAWEQAKRSYQLEAARYSDAAADLSNSILVARDQLNATRARRNAAHFSVQAAEWRYLSSIETLNLARSESISADLLFELGTLSRQTAQIYLERAVEAAFLMQQAFNLENNTNIGRIRLDYGDLSVADGLYAADFLMRDIDEFTFQSIAGVQDKLQSSLRVLSLRSHFPFAFFELIRTGETQFETTLGDFHNDLPGTYDARVKRLRVVVEANSGPDGIAGMLTSAGTSSVRQANGGSRTKIHGTETLILPRTAPLAEISAPVSAETGQLEIFENIGVATSWKLSLPPEWNSIDLKAMTDVKIVVAYWCRHNSVLEQQDIHALQPEGEGSYAVDIRLGDPRWNDLESRAQTTLHIDATLIPPHHRRDARLTSMGLIVLRPDGRVQQVKSQVTAASGVSGDFSTGPDGVVTIETSDIPGSFADIPLLQDFTIEFPHKENSDIASSTGTGLDLSELYVIQVVFEYRYRLRTLGK